MVKAPVFIPWLVPLASRRCTCAVRVASDRMASVRFGSVQSSWFGLVRLGSDGFGLVQTDT